MLVYLAYYHNGFCDEWLVLLDVCASLAIAGSVLAEHKQTRDKENEYKDEATWWTEIRTLRSEQS